MLLTSLENLQPPLHFLGTLSPGAGSELPAALSLPDMLENVGEPLMPS
jgi:hypothetical protein